MHKDREMLNAFTEVIEYKCFKNPLQIKLHLDIFSYTKVREITASKQKSILHTHNMSWRIQFVMPIISLAVICIKKILIAQVSACTC